MTGVFVIVTSLVILKEILRRLQQEQKLAEIPRPCDVFDLTGGTRHGRVTTPYLSYAIHMNNDFFRIVIVMLFTLGKLGNSWPTTRSRSIGLTPFRSVGYHFRQSLSL